MRKIVLMIISVITSSISYAQIYTQSTNNGAIIISPKGLQGSTNSTTSNENVSFGPNTHTSLTTGIRNTSIGTGSQTATNTGSWNTAVGTYSLEFNTSGYHNTAIGASAMVSNLTGWGNTAVGSACLQSATGSKNTAMGQSALIGVTGSNNTAMGLGALISNTSGNNNTSNGSISGQLITLGSNNTFLGYKADATADFSNSMALGSNTKVNASNKVRIGDANITVIEGQVAWSNPSDRRLKENIIYTNRLGLNFIDRLQTASYSYSADNNKIRYDGFIAQDVEKIIQELGVPFSGLKKSEDGFYSLAYSDFVIPLVNSVKELKKQNDELLNMLQKLILEVNNLKSNNANNNDETSKK